MLLPFESLFLEGAYTTQLLFLHTALQFQIFPRSIPLFCKLPELLWVSLYQQTPYIHKARDMHASSLVELSQLTWNY